jgi:hypothetical protein
VVRFHHSPSLLPLHPDIFISFLLIRISRSRSRRLSISILLPSSIYSIHKSPACLHPLHPLPYILFTLVSPPSFNRFFVSYSRKGPCLFRTIYKSFCFPKLLSTVFSLCPCAALSTSHNPLYAWFVLPYIHYCSFYLPFFLLPLSIFHLPLFLLAL